jgi:hypothetical protein
MICLLEDDRLAEAAKAAAILGLEFEKKQISSAR